LESTQSTHIGQTQATATFAESVENSLGSGPTARQPEGAMPGISNLKRKMDKINQEGELFKAEYTKLEDEVSSVTNSLSKMCDEIIAIRQDMTELSSTLREELVEFKQILLSMSETNNAPSPRRKDHRRSQHSDSACHQMTRECWTVIPLVRKKLRSLPMTGLKKQSHGMACVKILIIKTQEKRDAFTKKSEHLTRIVTGRKKSGLTGP
jgi:seryl-tRNA synthetase